MTTNFVNNSPYLRTSRDFPLEDVQLQRELSRSYIDIATAVNLRTIGIYALNRNSLTGNSWYKTSKKQESSRQLYMVAPGTTAIDLGFKLSSIDSIVFAYGSYLSGTSYYGLIYGTNQTLAGQVVFWLEVNPTSTTTDIINFNVGAGAPAVNTGTVVIEWLSKV